MPHSSFQSPLATHPHQVVATHTQRATRNGPWHMAHGRCPNPRPRVGPAGAGGQARRLQPVGDRGKVRSENPGMGRVFRAALLPFGPRHRRLRQIHAANRTTNGPRCLLALLTAQAGSACTQMQCSAAEYACVTCLLARSADHRPQGRMALPCFEPISSLRHCSAARCGDFGPRLGLE